MFSEASDVVKTRAKELDIFKNVLKRNPQKPGHLVMPDPLWLSRLSSFVWPKGL